MSCGLKKSYTRRTVQEEHCDSRWINFRLALRVRASPLIHLFCRLWKMGNFVKGENLEDLALLGASLNKSSEPLYIQLS